MFNSRKKIKELKEENKRLKRENEVMRKALAAWCNKGKLCEQDGQKES